MRKFTLIIINSLFIIISFSSLLLTQEVLDRIAAIVDDDIILESEVTQNAAMLAMQLQFVAFYTSSYSRHAVTAKHEYGYQRCHRCAPIEYRFARLS